MKALHSQYNTFKGKVSCGLCLIPFRSKLEGPANQGVNQIQGEDIIDEAFRVFRINVLFKNF